MNQKRTKVNLTLPHRCVTPEQKCHPTSHCNNTSVNDVAFVETIQLPYNFAQCRPDLNGCKMQATIPFQHKLLDNLSQNFERSVAVAGEDHSDADCFVCVILSHGEEGYVYGTNGRVSIDSIIKNFKGDASPSLAGKPKLFFIQVRAVFNVVTCDPTRPDFVGDVVSSKQSGLLGDVAVVVVVVVDDDAQKKTTNKRKRK